MQKVIQDMRQYIKYEISDVITNCGDSNIRNMVTFGTYVWLPTGKFQSAYKILVNRTKFIFNFDIGLPNLDQNCSYQ